MKQLDILKMGTDAETIKLVISSMKTCAEYKEYTLPELINEVMIFSELLESLFTSYSDKVENLGEIINRQIENLDE